MAIAEDRALHFPLRSTTSSCIPAPRLGVSSSAASSLVATLGEACSLSASIRDCSPACLPAGKRKPAGATQDPHQCVERDTAPPASWHGRLMHGKLEHAIQGCLIIQCTLLLAGGNGQ